ncbi:IclR family transcriptional regulator [Aquicoccus sp. G2-2]|uniref:IclR family transcriptional regulator n=1 Tax=Aquicoccus sp. G2-2 TaxID=3092120 RepID=UPI002AE01863|nr:IclR family transcriptional regulator [Aquicoccus sp. G2-2]MEA1114808.1 IclR family transcriptional regulator [Aquicoccus sp. G2-2]
MKFFVIRGMLGRMEKQRVVSVQTVGRASSVLSALAAGDSEGTRLARVAEATDLGKATVSRLLKALVEVGYVECDAQAKLYRLGYDLFLLGQSARRFHIIELARHSLDRLAAETGDTVFLSVRDGDMAHCLDRRTGSYPIRTLTLSVGDRRPLGVGAGSLALLAFEDDAEISSVLNANKAERTDFDRFGDTDLHEMIAAARKHGHTYNDGRIVTAMNAVGVPVMDMQGRVAASLSIAAIQERMDPVRREMIARLLKQEAATLQGLLKERSRGGTAPARSRAKEGIQ